MSTTIKNITLENFCGLKRIDEDFSQKVKISGQNESGKSTIKRAILYALNCKDENGKEISGIRPHNKDGVDIDGLETAVALTLDIDREEKCLKKVFRQNFNKKGEFSGNVTDYYINDIPKKLSDYETFLDSIIPSEYRNYCVNANTLLLQGQTDQRAVLQSAFGKYSLEEVCDMFPEFAEIKPMLKDGTIAELKKRCNEQLNGRRGKSSTKGLKDLLKEYPARIDEAEKQKVDIDVAELELLKNSLNEQIAENKAKQEDISKQFEEQQKASDGILELKFELSDLQRKANEENNRKRRELEEEISSADMSAQQHSRTIILANDKITSKKRDLSDYEKYIAECRDMWNETNALEFDENSLICSMCGQEYPDERKDQIRGDFKQKKADKLADISDKGNGWKQRIKETKAEIEQLEKSVEIATKQKEMAEKRSEELEEQLDKLPQSIDISDRPEVQEIQRQIAEKEAAMNKGNSAEKIRQKLKDKCEDLQSRLSEVEKQIAKSEINIQIDERIEEINKEWRKTSQQIADVERQQELLKSLEIRSNELLEESVNENFEHCKVKLFRTLVNGDLEMCCSFEVDGTPYNMGLNHGNRILTELDVCMAFQKKCEVEMFVILDDTESIDDWRIPQIGNQMILLERTNDKELKIETEG